MRRSVQRGNLFGDASWTEDILRRLGLGSTIRPRGRPKKPRVGS